VGWPRTHAKPLVFRGFSSFKASCPASPSQSRLSRNRGSLKQIVDECFDARRKRRAASPILRGDEPAAGSPLGVGQHTAGTEPVEFRLPLTSIGRVSEHLKALSADGRLRGVALDRDVDRGPGPAGGGSQAIGAPKELFRNASDINPVAPGPHRVHSDRTRVRCPTCHSAVARTHLLRSAESTVLLVVTENRLLEMPATQDIQAQ
jgi:hypothetical protein